jgi:hypothetical protein
LKNKEHITYDVVENNMANNDVVDVIDGATLSFDTKRGEKTKKRCVTEQNGTRITSILT